MRRRQLLHSLWVLTALVPLGVKAELVVLQDNGRTYPLAPFLGVLTPPDAPPSAPAMQHLGAADPTRLLPLRSPGLTPGPVLPRPLPELYQNTLTRPVFLAAATPISVTFPGGGWAAGPGRDA